MTIEIKRLRWVACPQCGDDACRLRLRGLHKQQYRCEECSIWFVTTIMWGAK